MYPAFVIMEKLNKQKELYNSNVRFVIQIKDVMYCFAMNHTFVYVMVDVSHITIGRLNNVAIM